MNSTDLAFLPALEQSQLIRRREVSPLELTQLYLDRIEQFDSKFGSYFTVLAEEAIADAKTKTEQVAQVEDPNTLPQFFGVPISVKDLNPMKGVPYTLGCGALKQSIGEFDDATIGKIRQAGFVILGKTATPELGTMPFTEPPDFPPARNPWNLEYTPGGSSGGAAASLAAGLCAIAQGSDGGGSIRGPAFCCGLLGIKPSRGRISYAPIGDTPGGIATNGPLARTVADAAAFLDVVSGYVVGDPYWLPDPDPSFLQTARSGAVQGTGKPLKVAYATKIKPFDAIHPTCEQAVLDTVQRLIDLGHHAEEIEPDYSALIDPFTLVFRACLSGTGVPIEAMSPMNQWLVSHNDTAGAYFAAVWQMQIFARQLVAQFSAYDVVVMPVYTQPQIRVGEWADLSPEQAFDKVAAWIAPCPPLNATGQPAIALPTGFAETGLPTGVQLVGRPGDESTLIAVAAQIETHRPWIQHAPTIESRW
ncbi:MAG: amidase [Cyanothece sp. SIO2G6]|nr:amidase [Cyanothece sp. SIO2G6]